MKFGKKLKEQIQESLPEWRDKFLSYNDLKKIVKLISSAPPLLRGSLEYGKSEDDEFVYLLNKEIDKFNAFFIEQEEDFIIRHKELQQRIQRLIHKLSLKGKDQASVTEYKQEMRKIKKDIVNFHGEMVLLMHYSNINYTGLGKILKKYDKRTGGLLRLPFIQKTLQQPFFTTDQISKLIKQCERIIDSVLFQPPAPPAAAAAAQKKLLQNNRETILTVVGDQGIFRNTVAALVTMKEIRRGSSTYGHHSLPPLNLPDYDIIQSLQQTTSPLVPIP